MFLGRLEAEQPFVVLPGSDERGAGNRLSDHAIDRIALAIGDLGILIGKVARDADTSRE